MSEARIDTLGGLRIDIEGLDPRNASYAQVTLYRTGPETLPPRWLMYRAFAPIDSLRPGTYRVRVQMIGYYHPTLDVTIRPGELVRLLARMRENRVQMGPVVN
jgi:hypothetical protein